MKKHWYGVYRYPVIWYISRHAQCLADRPDGAVVALAPSGDLCIMHSVHREAGSGTIFRSTPISY